LLLQVHWLSFSNKQTVEKCFSHATADFFIGFAAKNKPDRSKRKAGDIKHRNIHKW